MSQESDVCCTTSMYDIQNRCIPDEIDLFYFKTCIITHNNNVIEQNINVSMFDILSVKEPHSEHVVLSFLVVFARSILDGLLYTIVKLIWKLIQSRIVPNLVLVDIFFGNGNNFLVLDEPDKANQANEASESWLMKTIVVNRNRPNDQQLQL